MSLDALIMLSGAFVVLLPFLGFPLKWDNVLLVLVGAFVILLGIIVRRRGLVRRATPKGGTFVESVPRTEGSAETHA